MERELAAKLPKGYNDWLKAIIIICIILCAGWFTINQVIDYRYKLQLLKDPCHLCIDKYPSLQDCIENTPLNIPVVEINPKILAT